MQALYDSPWHNPGLFWLAGVLFFAALGRRLGSWYAFLLLFGVEILADATLTGGWSPVPGASPWSSRLGVLFVILGDLRYFWLQERVIGGQFGGGVLARTVGLSLVVPVLSFVVPMLVPGPFHGGGRPLFLLYEVLLFALTLALWGLRYRSRLGAGPEGRAARELTAFELVQYGSWAAADVVILAGVEAGYGLRLLPNTMYYALFLPFVLWRFPALSPTESRS
jgi:hypothetical protein